MQIKFLGQPFDDQLGETLGTLLERTGVKEVKLLTAWAKASGLRRLGGQLETARANGATIEIVVGVDQGGASVEGLHALLGLADRAYVFFNPSAPKRTFHPKVYLVDTDAEHHAIVGSGNLTSGGLYTNYEAAVWCWKAHQESSTFFEDLHKYYAAFRDDQQACRVLSAELISLMQEDPRIRIATEASRAGGDRTVGSGATGEFEASTTSLRNAPQPTIALPGPDGGAAAGDEDDNDDGVGLPDHEEEVVAAESDAEAGVLPPAAGTGSAQPVEAYKALRFYKKLSSFDVSAGSAPGQIIIPIRFLPFFGPLQPDTNVDPDVGSAQESRSLTARLVDSRSEVECDDARVVHYTPGPLQARKNTEVRFTFRNHEAFDRLQGGDYLTFEWQGDVVVVTRTQQGPGATNFDWL